MAKCFTNVTPARGFHYDAEAAEAAVAFFPAHLRHTKGEWFGRPFVLAPWEADDIVRPLFGWKRQDGTRRYRRCVVWIARKNGKSELAAGVSLIALMADGEPGAEVLTIATNKDQARIVFDIAATMFNQSDSLDEHLVRFTNSIYCPEISGVLKPLSGIPKGKHGLNMSGLIGDEVHEWPTDRLYTFVHQSSAGRRQPLEFLISSAGEKQGFGWELYQHCEGLLSGEAVDDETMVVVYRADADRDRRDPDYWKSDDALRDANPNFGVSPKIEYLTAERKRATRSPRLENDFKRYHLNLWVEQATRWLPMDAWHDCGQPVELRPALRAAAEADVPPSPEVMSRMIPAEKNERWRDLPALMKGRRAFGGIDLSTVTDTTCLVWVFPPEEDDTPGSPGLWTVVPRFYCPEVGIKRRSQLDKVPYDQWVAAGAMIATKGNAVDYQFLKRDLIADAEVYSLVEDGAVAVDRYNASQITIEINDEGISAKMFGQGFVSMNGPAMRLESLILSRNLDHGGHPVLTWMARNAAVEKDAAGNIKPSKAKSTERIDGIVGTTMAIGAAMEAPKELNLGDFISNPVFA